MVILFCEDMALRSFVSFSRWIFSLTNHIAKICFSHCTNKFA
jgi:hypothetical protein